MESLGLYYTGGLQPIRRLTCPSKLVYAAGKRKKGVQQDGVPTGHILGRSNGIVSTIRGSVHVRERS